jgi:hypothetical protein
MDQLLQAIFAAPVANLFVIVGLIFLGVAAIGKIGSKIKPDKTGRLVFGLMGVILIIVGLRLQADWAQYLGHLLRR